MAREKQEQEEARRKLEVSKLQILSEQRCSLFQCNAERKEKLLRKDTFFLAGL